jgi:hypothetical protein
VTTRAMRTEYGDCDLFLQGSQVRLTSLTLSCTAKAHVPKFARRGGCDVRAAISGARKAAGGVPPSELCSTQALQRRTEVGP